MDILEFLKEQGIRSFKAGDGRRDKHISPRGDWAQMVCPICGTDHLWLGYNIENDYFHCFNHGSCSKWELFKAWFHGQDVKALLAGLEKPISVDSWAPVVSGRYLPPKPLMPLRLYKRHVAYLRGRGLDPEEMSRKWGMMAIPVDGEPTYCDRIFIPVCDVGGRPVSWQARTIRNNSMRYLAAPKERESVPIKELLYGEHLVNRYDTVIVTEGVFDAVKIGKNAVATFGKKLTPTQIGRIAQFPRRVICFDSEDITQQQARELAFQLSMFPGVTDNVCLDSPDPGSATASDIASLLRFAQLA